MKKLYVAVFLSAGLLFALGCSSAPPGMVSVGDLIAKESEYLGQNVVVVGTAETKTSMSEFNMFRIFHRNDQIWVAFPDTIFMPPQGEKIRVTGKLNRKRFSGLPEEVAYIEATAISIE